MKDTFRNTPEREEYLEKLKQKAESLGVAHAIRWVDQVPMEELPDYYNLSDVVVSVPNTDGMPVTLFEAMACQKPVIVGDLSSYNEVIIHGQTGLRVPIRNAQVLARAIIKIAKNPALAKRLVEESQVVLHQYGIFEEQLMRMERYYKAMATRQLRVEHNLGKGLNHQLLRLVIGVT